MAKPTVLLNAREMVDYLGAFADDWHSESEAFLEPNVIERLHDWGEALATVEDAEDEQNQRAKSGRLYIGNLPYTVTREQLAALFVDAGLPVVDLHVPLDATQRARGFAFVSVGTAEATKQSIAKLNGIFFGGRRISVRVADPRPPSRS
jgi:RNA recognition motif-containing protein